MSQHHPAGWYPQPDGSQRYWDGNQWTGNVAAGTGSGDAGGQTAAAQADNQQPRPWYRKKRVMIPGVFLAFVLAIAATTGGDGDDIATPAPVATVSETPTIEAAEAVEETVAEEARAAGLETEADPAPPAPEPEPEPEAPSLTTAQQQAVRSAKDYLDFTAFSRSGLVEQLEFEDFSTADATFAVDNIDVDWTAQAVRSAEEYLDFTAFSRSGLVEQLEFEGFSNADATHAVDNVDVDWMEQAALSAESYLDMTAFSRSGLIEQLQFEGFTREQAEHGAGAVGL